MLKPLCVVISGFRSIPETAEETVRLDEPGLTVILGDNGKGKTTRYAEAPTWGLYGRIVRNDKDPGDRVVNRHSASARVEVYLQDEDRLVCVVRTKTRGKAQSLEVYAHSDSSDPVPLFPAANLAEKQEKLEDWLGMDHRTFTNSKVFGQGVAAMFGSEAMTDEQRKQIFDQIGGTAAYDDARVVAEAERKVLEIRGAASATRHVEVEARLRMAREAVASRVEQEKQLAEGQKTARETLARETKLAREDLEQTAELCTAAERATKNAQAALDARDSSDATLSALRADRTTLVAALNELREKHENLGDMFASSRGRRDLLAAEADKLMEGVSSSKCAYCGAALSDVLAVKNHADEKLADVHITETVMAGITAELAGVAAELQDGKALLAEMDEALSQSERDRRGLVDVLSSRKSAEAALRGTVASKKKVLEALSDSERMLSERLAQARKDTAQERNKESVLAAEEAKARAERDEIEAKIAVATFWEEAFGPKGVKAFVIEGMLPVLNQRINEHLSYLSDGRITARVSATTMFKKGTTAERLSLEVIHPNGAEDYASHSGGERRRIDLALLLALQDMVGMRARRAFGVAIYDEVLDALDDQGITKAIEYLKLRAADQPTYVISHSNSVRALVEDARRIG